MNTDFKFDIVPSLQENLSHIHGELLNMAQLGITLTSLFKLGRESSVESSSTGQQVPTTTMIWVS